MERRKQEIIEKHKAKVGSKYSSTVGEGFAKLDVPNGKTLYLAAEASVPELSSEHNCPVVSLNAAVPPEMYGVIGIDNSNKKEAEVLKDQNFSTLGLREKRELELEARKLIARAKQIDKSPGSKAIVHCNQGRTRTPVAVATYYIMKNPGTKSGQALSIVTNAIKTQRNGITGVMGVTGDKMANVVEQAAKILLTQ